MLPPKTRLRYWVTQEVAGRRWDVGRAPAGRSSVGRRLQPAEASTHLSGALRLELALAGLRCSSVRLDATVRILDCMGGGVF
jgi:hypothetical protein